MSNRTRIGATTVAASCLLGMSLAWGIGGQFGMEFAIDAPWRMEPKVDGRQLSYGPIPINVTFLDSIFDEQRAPVERLAVNRIRVGRFAHVEIVERTGPGPIPGSGGHLTRVQPHQLREIQLKRYVSVKDAEPKMEVCEAYTGADCGNFLDITRTHEWHAMVYYEPKGAKLPGRNVQLEITVVTVRDGDERRFRNDLVVHLGEAPLPRFSDDWLYGDLHYHSQMTDNEGESGYTYRNSVRGLAAIGMDYVFATDHASASEQADGDFHLLSCNAIRGLRCRDVDNGGTCPDGNRVMMCFGKEARDLNPARYLRGLDEIRAANHTIFKDALDGLLPSVTNRALLPQIYMGEEIDAWPQMSNDDFRRGYIAYGDGERYEWANPKRCPKGSVDECKAHYATQPGGPRTPIFVLDDQGVTFKKMLDLIGIPAPWDDDPQPSRQHLVYFPYANGDGVEGFVPSNTGPNGGASRSLSKQISAMEDHGSAFLAHPMISSRPGSEFGPDVIPYSFDSLDIAWSSPAILGLQLWNENEKLESTVGDDRVRRVMAADNDGKKSFTYLLPWREGTLGNSAAKRWQEKFDAKPRIDKIRHGLSVWDLYLQKGLDPVETAKLSWLKEGFPRRWFMAGGSDGHGDLNYRRAGRPNHEKRDSRCEDFWCDFNVNDTALGKPRNLTLVSNSNGGQRRVEGGMVRVHTNRDVISALQRGSFSVTDGPALRIVVDRNRNERIDEDDFQMGSVGRIFPGDHIPLLIEWISTTEFGPVERVDVYVGTKDFVFAPRLHGPGDQSVAVSRYTQDRSGDNLQFDVPRELGLHGQATIYLAPEDVSVNAESRFFYARAYAETSSEGCPDPLIGGVSCGERFAFTNPVWGEYVPYCAGSSRAIDSDGNGQPDVCEAKIEDDPCLTALQERTSRRPGTSDQQQAPSTSGSSNSGSSNSNSGSRFGSRASRRFTQVTPNARITLENADGTTRSSPLNEERWESCSTVGPVVTGGPFDRAEDQLPVQRLRLN